MVSHPTMGAWIEIKKEARRYVELKSRTPRWVRGLKLAVVGAVLNAIVSHPTMGAWIEIYGTLDSTSNL